MDNSTRFQLMESYIMDQISSIEKELGKIKETENEYTAFDLRIVYARLNGQKDLLYKIMTAYDNRYDKKMSNKV